MNATGVQYPQSKFIGVWKKRDGWCIFIKQHQHQSHLISVLVGGVEATSVVLSGNIITFDWPNRAWGRASLELVTPCILLELKDYMTIRWVKVPSFLSAQDINHFRQNGFLVLQGAVPAMLIKKARRAILSDIGQHGIPPDKINEFYAQSFTPHLLNDSQKIHTLADIFKASVVPLAMESLFEIDNIPKPWEDPFFHPPQVAIRFPSFHPEHFSTNQHLLTDQEIANYQFTGQHIDGIPSESNGIQEDKFYSFSALVGVALTDQNENFAGNLVVYPGSHFSMNEKLRWQWDQQSTVPDIQKKLDHRAILGYCKEISNEMSPVQVNLSAGDAVICHHNLIHCVAENRSDNMRVQIYYRIRHRDHNEDSQLDLWRDFHPILSDEFNA